MRACSGLYPNQILFIMKKSMQSWGYFLMAGMITFASCKKDEVAAPKSLYERLGGNAAISAVTDQFIANVAGDARINAFFADAAADPARLTKLRNNLVNQLGEATGGTEKYTGLNMKVSHAGMGIEESHFNALVEDLALALDKFKVPTAEKNELLGALAPMKTDIVEGPKTLYVRLGGNAAISAVVDDFLTKVVADNRINSFFAATVASSARVTKLRNNLINQIGEASGGPEKYTGLDMKTSHKGMKITDAHFNALVEDLQASLVKFKVESRTKIQLLNALGAMRGDIVGQ
jgi:truncated hemoglobin YjbI